jgi:Spy/CpxP family protein refolding chaperone
MKSMIKMVACFLLVSGCASSKNEALDKKMASESGTKGTMEFRDKMNGLIDNETQMTAGQRDKLNSLRMDVITKTDRINAESYQLRSVLMKDLLASTYDRREVAQIKDRIKNLEDRRLSLLFESSDQARKILGRESMIYPQIVHEFVRSQNEPIYPTEVN